MNPYVPDALPLTCLDIRRLISKVGPANAVFQTADFIDRSKIAKPTATTSLKKLKDAGILIAIREASGSRPAVLAFPELINKAEGRKVL